MRRYTSLAVQRRTLVLPMREFVTTITSKGRETIPAVIRRLLGLETEDKLAFDLTEEGSVELRAPDYPTVASLVGAAGSLEQAMSWEAMRDIVREDRLAAKSSPRE